MRKFALVLALPAQFASQYAMAGSSSGNAALTLAALVARQSPFVSSSDKLVMTRMLDGRLTFHYPSGHKIDVKADAIDCRASDVDISSHLCDLAFGARSRNFRGRTAAELYGALTVAGAPSDGTAGAQHESVRGLDCVIDPNEVKQKAGGGASCNYQ